MVLKHEYSYMEETRHTSMCCLYGSLQYVGDHLAWHFVSDNSPDSMTPVRRTEYIGGCVRRVRKLFVSSEHTVNEKRNDRNLQQY